MIAREINKQQICIGNERAGPGGTEWPAPHSLVPNNFSTVTSSDLRECQSLLKLAVTAHLVRSARAIRGEKARQEVAPASAYLISKIVILVEVSNGYVNRLYTLEKQAVLARSEQELGTTLKRTRSSETARA